MLKPPTLQTIVARAERDGRSSVNISVAAVKRFIEVEAVLERLADQTGITEADPRLQRWQ
jgi:hypothetical protein